MARLWVDLDRAAQIYIESAEAQHGNLEMARAEAEDWLRIFNWVIAEVEDKEGDEFGETYVYPPGH